MDDDDDFAFFPHTSNDQTTPSNTNTNTPKPLTPPPSSLSPLQFRSLLMARSKSTPTRSNFIDLTADDDDDHHHQTSDHPVPPPPPDQRLHNILSHFYKHPVSPDLNLPSDFEFPNFRRRLLNPTVHYFGASSSSSSSIYHNSSPSKRVRISQNQEFDDFDLGFQLQSNDLFDDQRGLRNLGHSDSSDDVVIIDDDDDEDDDDDGNGNNGVRRFTREEKGKGPPIEIDFLSRAFPIDEPVISSSDSDDGLLQPVAPYNRPQIAPDNRFQFVIEEERRNRFREVAKENASKYALFKPNSDVNDDNSSLLEPEVQKEIFDSSTPFSKAMKTIKERGVAKNFQTDSWVPKMGQKGFPARFSIPSLQELCLEVLARNADAVVSLDGVPDDLRHKLSQMLCDSRKMNYRFFELLFSGSPTEIRLRDCSWMLEEEFTNFCKTCDTANLKVLQLDQCGRCVPDYALLDTLGQSPGGLPRLISLSLSGACRLSDKGLRVLVSSAPVLRSVNLCQCSLLTSACLNILAESLGSFLKELYLDDCQNIDAAMIVPALKELAHLEVLSLAGVQSVSDEFIKNYIVPCGHSMKELVLKDCINLTDASMKVIAEHCPMLRVLDLMNLSKLTDISIRYLADSCLSLNTLRLCRNPFSDEAIAAFINITGESLTELSLNNIRKVGRQTSLSLASCGKNLHALDLSWCRHLTDNELGLIVDNCCLLRLLKLFGCSQVTDNFLHGHSNHKIQIIGLKMTSLLQHVKMSGPLQGALRYSSAPVDLM
ncbi:hypothetical protein RIF29_07236 [Crotalaria pallida]|uniref:F-box/LRR-repeat protein 15-like leucin rich repeat domain-containing protein n=1 Tax=Crotalaria pallida TaxID=3830 RepID=A0AAN9PBA9_CROPI